MRRLAGLCAALLLSCAAPLLHAAPRAAIPVTVDVRHVGQDLWRVDYRFAQAVTALKLEAVGEYRATAWKVLTPGLQLKTGAETDLIAAKGKPFKSASVEIRSYDRLAPKAYASFNRFSDGGSAMFLGHLHGTVQQGGKALAMQADVRLAGLPQEQVIAPPLNHLLAGGERGYAYFGPAQAVAAGAVKVLFDPATPAWAREVVLEAGAKVSAYYAQAYQRPLKDQLVIMVSVAGIETPGLSMKGGAVLGQLSYRLEGQLLPGDHPKKREYLTRLVAHEMAHIWQLNIARGGVGENDPWIHEGGAEAMALDALQQTGLASEESLKAYRAKQAETCQKLGNTVDSYDGIYACGLSRFDQLGIGIVPLWRAMMQATEEKGEVYSAPMIEGIVGSKAATSANAGG